jgi:putative ABC transport system permease protein
MYRLVLRLYPPGSRLRRAPELERIAKQLIETAKQRSGRRGAAKAWLDLWLDVLRTLPAEWLDFAGGRIGAVVRGRRRGVSGEPVSRKARATMMMDWVMREYAQALRRLRRSPGFAMAAVLTIALGIGSASAVFSVVNAVLLRPLPYAEPDRLIALEGKRSDSEISMSWLDLQDYRERNHTFESIAGFVSQSFTLTEGGPAEQVRGQMVTSDLFRVVRTEPVLGRDFTAQNDRPGGERVAVIGNALWQRRYGGDPGIVGRTVLMNSEPYTVIGVMPAGFEFPGGIVYGSAEIWVPIGLVSGGWTDRDDHPGLYAIGRLRAGETLASARADLESIALALTKEYPGTNEKIGVRAQEALDSMVGSVRPALLSMLAGVGLLLLIVCANIAHLLIVRATAKGQETKIRAALGASRTRLLAPALCESVLLSVAGGTIGLAVAVWLTRAGGVLLGRIPRGGELPLDGRVVAFTALVTVMVVLLSGALPALQSGRGRTSSWLRSRSASRSAVRVRSSMVVGQVALSTVVLIGAGLVGKSFSRLMAVDPGVRPDGVLTFYVRLPEADYDADRTGLFYESMLERIRAVPGVESAGAISVLPFTGAGSQSGIMAAGGTRDDERRTDVNVVTPEYFRAMGVGLVAGRTFGAEDNAASTPVVVVDETLAGSLWPGESAVGKRIAGWGLHDAEVIGVVRHVMNYGVAADSREELYMAHAQRPFNAMRMIVRTAGDPLDLVTPVRRIIGELDPAIPLDRTARMADIVDGTLATPRLTAVLGTGFAAFATLLAAVGLYGVMAYGVTQRRREIGTRVALGAPTGRVATLVIRDGLRLVVAGAAMGLAGALAASRLLESQIYGISRTDPATFVLLPLLLMGVAAMAAFLPAYRATRISPMEALRSD